jgi:hypothetical protein
MSEDRPQGQLPVMIRRRKSIVADGVVAGSLCGRITRDVPVTAERCSDDDRGQTESISGSVAFSLSPLVEGQREEPGGEAKDD